jgi:integrase
MPLITPSPEPHLYDLVATRDGFRVSPTCADGHVLVMELIQQLGLLDRMQPRDGRSGAVDRGFMLGRGGHGASAIVMPSLAAPHSSVSPILQAISPAPTPTPPPPGPPPPSPAPNTAPIPVVTSSGKRLSELMALNLANLSRGPKKATPATRDRRYILTMLLDVLGDKPVADITADDANAMADVLASWPRNLAHYQDLKDLPVRKVAAITKKKKLPAIQRSTQYKHIMSLNAFFNWCVDTGAIAENPFHYVENSRYRDVVPKKRDIFSAQDLQTLFDPKHVRHYTEPHKYWVPLIAMFTGMRVNEISQLYVEDIQSDTELDEEGVEHTIPYFDITPLREGQSVKTGYSMRRIPIPAQLLELGFERYVADVRASGSPHLFPGLAWEEGGPGRTVSRWFNKHHLRNACGITSAKKSLHCFRHTLTTRCDRANVPKSIIQTLNGHSDGKGVDERTYVARGSLLECKRVLEQLKYPPLDLMPYVSERFATYLAQAAAHAAHDDRLAEDEKPAVIRKGRRPKFTPTTS